MNIQKIIKNSTKPIIYTKGNAEMWTDPYISKQLLDVHINPDVDLGSRKIKTIQKTTEWILTQAGKKKLNILDLGCGPGLYTELFAQKGHQVTGVDFSSNSINYAKKRAGKKNLDITYIQANYLNLDLAKNQFDLIILIYTDLGVLLPEERSRMLNQVNELLKEGGIFIFDLLNNQDLEKKTSLPSWEASNSGFWSEKPYLALSNSFLYPENQVILYQHMVMIEQETIKIYRFWTQFFSPEKVTKILTDHYFKQITYHKNILPKGDIWNGENVVFYKAVKN